MNEALIDGRYLRLEELGRGGSSVVYRVSDLLYPERPLALKIASSSDEQSRLLLGVEFSEQFKLAHPAIPAAYDFGYHLGETAYFTQDFIRGSTLSRLAKMGSLDEPGALRTITVQLADTLHYLHERGIRHLDLKPGNVLLEDSRPDRTFLIDFGIRAAKASGRFVRPLGTPGFVAPEAQNSEAVDVLLDLFALGATLYAACERRSVYARGEAIEFRRGLAESDPELATLITALCSLDPSARPNAAEVLRRLGGAERLPGPRLVGVSELVERCVSRFLAGESLQIVGPPGAGKTRILGAIGAELETRGLRVARVDAEATDTWPSGKLVALLDEPRAAQLQTAPTHRIVTGIRPLPDLSLVELPPLDDALMTELLFSVLRDRLPIVRVKQLIASARGNPGKALDQLAQFVSGGMLRDTLEL